MATNIHKVIHVLFGLLNFDATNQLLLLEAVFGKLKSNGVS